VVLSGGKLDPLQTRVLDLLGGIEPPFVLSGGAALTGVYLGHRTTRDLDLFWRNRANLGDLPQVVEQRLAQAGLSVTTLQTTPAFVRLRAVDASAVVVIDLIAEASSGIGSAERHTVGRVQILVDSPRAILAEKLCALLERSELRDLLDVDALLRNGESLDVALTDAPRRDGGFSPLALAWVLRDFHVRELALVAGIDVPTANRLEAFRESLVERLIEPRSNGGA
jgi:Nucleotidyl transferase AbiEii toxin, Type IV TA system